MSRTRPVVVRGDVVGVVPVPDGRRGRVLALGDLDGEPLVVHAVRAALGVAATVAVLAPANVLRPVRDGLDAAGLGRVGTGVRGGPDLAAAVAAALGRPDGDLPPGCSALLVHDPLCPLTPARHLDDVLGALGSPGATGATGATGAGAGVRAGAAVHPVTDTVKTVHEDGEGWTVAGTVDRERLRVVTTPVVVPAASARLMPATAGGADLVSALRAHGEVVLVPAPPVARRVHDRAGLHLVLGLRDVAEHRDRRVVPG